MVGYAICMAVVTGAYYLLPSWHIIIWSTIGVISAGAVLVGVVTYRPSRRVPWLLLSAALLTFAAGDATYGVLTDVLGWDNPFPSVADIFYLAMYPLLAAGLLIFIQRRAGWRDRGSLLDALTLTAGLALLSWIFLITPYVTNPDLTVLEKATSIAYPLGDVLILATLARLLTAAREQTRAVDLLGLGTVGLLVGDVLYGLIQLNGSWHTGTAVDLGWVVFYASWGAAALHPSMVRLTQPLSGRPAEVDPRRLVLLTLASLIAPAVLLKEAILGGVRNGLVIAVLSGVVFLLVLRRLSGVVATHRQALARERGLRDASAALVASADVDEVAAAVHTAVAGLLPPDTVHNVVLLVSDGPGAHPGDDDRKWRVPGSDGFVRRPTAMATRATQLLRTQDLDADLATGLPNCETTLLCPLALDDRLGGDPFVGLLLVGADEWTLLALEGALEVLASQAALAIERVALTYEVNRRNNEAYFRTLVHNTSDVILIVGDDDRIGYASPSATAVFGIDTMTGVALKDVMQPKYRELASETLEWMRDERIDNHSADWHVLRSDGRCIEVEVDCRNLRHDRTVRGLVLTLRDVTERRQLERELTHRAFHDSLTGLANRVLFRDRVERALARARREGQIVGVLFMDLDDFKVVNDTMGHASGDELLIAVAQRLKGLLREHDTAARLGGDEFAVLIEDATHPVDVEQVAEALTEALAEPFTLANGVMSGVASIGLATTAEAADAQELLRHADLALYVAKGAGKGQWRRYQAMLHTAMLERLELRAALEHAVADGAFTLRYQPIVDLVGGDLVGFEALVRWQHPARGVVPPGQFIEVAEESGLIAPLGSWVLDHALADVAEWLQAGAAKGLQYVSVNVSPQQFRTPGFVAYARQALANAGIPPQMLVLEITESLLLRNDEQVFEDLVTLRELGVKIAIDDFGTGYSSLSYLRRLPIDILKIDKSFLDDMIGSEQQTAVVDAIVRLADTLDLRVIAEGIEDPAHRDLLARIGCRFGQGFLFARPMRADEAARWLRFGGPVSGLHPEQISRPLATQSQKPVTHQPIEAGKPWQIASSE
jgi:diguanylate cyclase (GGDEF)-like protein/PAS domain S-box-containing protein